MDILICSKLFFPDSSIGAVRVTNFAKYLKEMGHQVTVITGPTKATLQEEPLSNSINIIRINHSNTTLKLISSVEGSIKSRKTLSVNIHAELGNKESVIKKLYQKFKNFRLQVYTMYLQIDWLVQAKKVINNKIFNSKHDVVLSSFGPLGSHLVARYLKKIKQANFWVADLRDNMQNEDYSKIINLIYLYFEKDMMVKADAITVVSKGQYSMLQKAVGLKRFKNKNVNILYNGYEKKIEPESQKNNLKILKIAYTGSLYSGKRDMSLFFKCLKELITEKKIELNRIEVHYAGTSSSDLLKQASFYGIQAIIHDHGYLSRAASIKLQESSDILVVLSWNTLKEQGILSGKFFEYIQAFKPIIAITSGDLADSELTEMVKELNVGIACEYIQQKNDLILLKDYVLLQYNHIMMDEVLAFEPNIEKVRSFHYKQVVEQLEKICMKPMKK